MKCKCGSIVTISDDNFAAISDIIVITCNDCNRAYFESDFSEIEIEKTYWSNLKSSKLPAKSDNKL